MTFVIQNLFHHCHYKIAPIVLFKGLVVDKDLVRASASEKGHKMKFVQSPITVFVGFLKTTDKQFGKRWGKQSLMFWHQIIIHHADQGK